MHQHIARFFIPIRHLWSGNLQQVRFLWINTQLSNNCKTQKQSKTNFSILNKNAIKRKQHNPQKYTESRVLYCSSAAAINVSLFVKYSGKVCAGTSSKSRNYTCIQYRNFSTNNYKKMAPILAPTIKLNNGYEMPVLGLGTYELKKTKCENAIREAIKIGYRHIDTAYLYGNEAIIGRILREQIDQNYVKRKDIFLVTKLWNIHHETDKVKYACKMQMEALKVDYIDLYLMHSPIGYKYVDDQALMPHKEDKLQTIDIDYVETYKAMEELVSFGWVRSLGLSNFNISQMQRILEICSIKPVTNQVECHPALNQKMLRTFCANHNIIVTAYSPLARPKPSKPLPAFYTSEKLQEISDKYQKTKAQIVLRYLIDLGTVPIPKSSNPERLYENMNIFDFQLSPDEISAINSLNTNTRLWRNEMAKFHPYWPFSEN
ncbi:1,5-anhydro-D-fructose reductase isoform X2 [Haematobia irritans]|uniref:1,5-anhydro-D-fructose reductase isoform X2 n=1 Tax=Haematobia irritans TaxID=7368 RepID=UPI003F4F68C5